MISPGFFAWNCRFRGQNVVKMVKKSPYKIRYKRYLQEIDHIRGGEDVKVTLFDILPKFTLFWGHIGAKPGVKKGKNVPISQ